VGETRSYEDVGVALVLRRAAAAYAAPGGAVVARFGRVNENGVGTTFRALAARLDARCRPQWYRAQLPIRPNGAQGWVEAAAVRRYAVDFRIVVDLSDRRITVFRRGAVVARTVTAIGARETPTPTGSYYVNQRLLAPDPTGPWGPGGIGISAFSPVLVDWPQGGPIAIHGTNAPWTIGRAASNGCLRIDNDVLERLIHLVPDGTPVRIQA
jgi:lipoprotein-anchoring transpeptidase ErfK/SrfK